MSFCGQCGYLLAPNSIKCPRCGARIETPDKDVVTHSDTPTIHSQPGNISPANDHTWQSIRQQETTLRASNEGSRENTDTAGPYHSATAEDPTITPHGPAGSFYPPQTPPYAAFPAGSEHIAHTQRGDISSYPSMVTSPTTDYPEHPYLATPPAAPPKKSTALTLAIIAFILAAVLTTTLLFIKPQILQQISQQNTVTPTVVTSPPTAVTRTPEQQAQAVVERYFASVNHKDYQTAYNLWAPPPSSYNDFANGYAHTKHDDIQFGTLTQQNDGTVQVPIIITALTDTNTKETFSGYYTVGQQPDHSWKITGAKINPGTGS